MKYYVEFTEETTKSHGYYVEADNKEEAYLKAEDRYFEHEKADSISTSYAKTLGHSVEEA